MGFKRSLEAGLAALGIAISSGAKAEEPPQRPDITHVEHINDRDKTPVLVDEDGLISEKDVNFGKDDTTSPDYKNMKESAVETPADFVVKEKETQATADLGSSDADKARDELERLHNEKKEANDVLDRKRAEAIVKYSDNEKAVALIKNEFDKAKKDLEKLPDNDKLAFAKNFSVKISK